jgi:ATP-dependent DNA helicase RecG
LGREGRHTTPISARQLRKILLDRGVYHFESESPPEATLADLDFKKVEDYLNVVALPDSNTPPDELLLRRGCLREINGVRLPTYACLLLFGHHPQRWLPSATILAAHFSGPEFGDAFIKRDITGTIPNQLQQAVQFATDQMGQRVSLTGLTHETHPEYPLAAIRELLVNAVTHRDYNHQGDTIHLNLFSNRLAVLSPGTLPGPITVENILTTRFSRNPVLVQVLADLGYVERLGYGLTRVLRVTREAGLPPPQFAEVGGAFRAVIYRGFATTKTPAKSFGDDVTLNTRQKLALSYLTNQPRITNRIYQGLCPDVHPETLRRDLADLVNRGLVIKIGDKRATYYILKSQSSN